MNRSGPDNRQQTTGRERYGTRSKTRRPAQTKADDHTSRLYLCSWKCSPRQGLIHLFAVDEHIRASVERKATARVLLALELAHQVGGVVSVLSQDTHRTIHTPFLRCSSQGKVKTERGTSDIQHIAMAYPAQTQNRGGDWNRGSDTLLPTSPCQCGGPQPLPCQCLRILDLPPLVRRHAVCCIPLL